MRVSLSNARLYAVHLPGAGDEDAMSSSSSLILFRRAELLGPRLAADMLGRKGELRSRSVWRDCLTRMDSPHGSMFGNEIFSAMLPEEFWHLRMSVQYTCGQIRRVLTRLALDLASWHMQVL